MEEEESSSSSIENEDVEEDGSEGEDLVEDSSSDEELASLNSSDSSDEEDLQNTIGNIPISWYDDLDHIGYSADGKKIQKKGIKRSEIDEALARMEDPDYWRKVRDATGKEVKLSDRQAEMIQNLRSQRYPEIGYNPYQPFLDFFTQDVMEHPVTNRPDTKASFIPSKLDKEKVSKMVYAIKMGWLKPRKKQTDEESTEPQFYDLWGESSKSASSKSEVARMKMHIPAPKTTLPDHSESYNPPVEYLPTKEEKEEFENETEEEERKRNYLPQKYDSYRRVPGYSNFIKERFERCLDLYLAPRMKKERLNIKPEDLLPELPSPKDLQPFPNTLALTYKGHTGLVRAIAIEPRTGEFMASGGDDECVRIWDVASGRMLRSISMPGVVHSISWSPDVSLPLLIVAAGKTVVIVSHGVGNRKKLAHTNRVLAKENVESKWEQKTVGDEVEFHVVLQEEIKTVDWHSQGDYFLSVSNAMGPSSLVVHQLSTRKSEFPLSTGKRKIQTALFHPKKALLFVAEERHVKIYDLVKQQLVKKLLPNSRSISCLAVHPKGDNLLCGGHDCRITWFDLDLSSKPYKTYKHFHRGAIRSVAFHGKYPLFATSSDDASTYVFHGRIFNDLLQNPLIVPLKRLGGHKVVDSLGVLASVFHPSQPWIITAGADGTLRLYVN